MGAVGVGTSIFGGAKGASAAKKASAAQAEAAQAASDRVGEAVGQANAPIADATKNAQELAIAGGDRVLDTAGRAKAGMDEQARNANALLDPYTTTGQTATAALNAGLAAGGDFNKAPTLADLQMDPGYAWRAQQAEEALARRGAAAGGYFSGAALKDLNNYVQGSASQEYQNAFNRFETATQNRFGNLMTAANAGQNAAGQQGQNLIGAAQYGGNITTQAANTALGANEFAGQAAMQGAGQIADNTMRGAIAQGDYTTQKGNAQAAGYVGSANAWNGMAGGVSNAVTGAATMNLMKNPATGLNNGYYSSTRGYVRT